MCCSSTMASRPLSSTASSAVLASSGEEPSIRRAAPACTTIMLTLCVTTSCSSPAMRARSSRIACRVAFSCSSVIGIPSAKPVEA